MTDDHHLDLLELDAHRAGEPLPAGARAHLAWCRACQRTLAELDAAARTLSALPVTAAVPPEREAVILALAGQRAALARATRRGRRRPGVGVRWAAAAALVLAVGALALSQRRAIERAGLAAAPAARPTLTRAQADLNGDGRVDVLDAFALARAVTHGTPRVGDADRHDVDVILAMAVSLDGREIDR